jgi:exopolyphosphatase / guanosine-5'-triphosphate,3'-diphosphate pyrophosphatase
VAEIADSVPAVLPAPRVEERPYRIAAIDVGTNSIHMIVAEAQGQGYRVIDKEKEMVQLGRGALERMPLTDAAMSAGVSTLRSMVEIARRHSVDDIVAVATSAIREAPNRKRFIAEVQRAAGIDLRVISGEEEADYIYRAVRSAVEFHGGTSLSIDIGGGSVELILGTSTEVFLTRSEPLGSLRVAQRFGLESAVGDRQIKKTRRAIRKMLKKSLARIASVPFDFTIGTSGTIVTLAELAGGAKPVTSGLRWITRSRVRELIRELAPLTTSDRAKKFNLEEKRAGTIVGGAIVLDEVMRGLEIEHLRACDAALREGIVETMLDRLRDHAPDPAGVRRTSVLELAERMHLDIAHAEHVAHLAVRIFDQLEDVHRLRTGERELLESAALLHEAGMHVSYQGHHKHSYYLISHAGLRGFTSDQVAIIANVARYYRKAPPHPDHQNYAQLSPAQQDVVRKLAAILRIAAALDRGRHAIVSDIDLDLGENVVSFGLALRGDADLEIEHARRKAKLFAEVFGAKPAFRAEVG